MWDIHKYKMKYIINYYLLNIINIFIPHPKLRALYFKLLGAKIGKNVRIEKVTFIQVQHTIKNLCCNDNTFIGSGVTLDLSAPITLDKYAAVAPGCTILTHQDLGEFNGNILSSIYQKKISEVYLERNVVVGVDSTILAGVRIGKFSVVGAKSLVFSDVPDYVLVSGIHAKVVGKHGCLLPQDC